MEKKKKVPAKNFLSSENKKKLQDALITEERAEVRQRILMFLLLNDGKTYKAIANFIGCSERRVAYWCVHGDPENLDSLQDGRRNRKSVKVTKEYRKLLLEVVEKEPQELGVVLV